MAQIDIEKKSNNNKNNKGLYIIIAILVIAGIIWWISSGDDNEEDQETIRPAVMEHPMPSGPDTDPAETADTPEALALL